MLFSLTPLAIALALASSVLGGNTIPTTTSTTDSSTATTTKSLEPYHTISAAILTFTEYPIHLYPAHGVHHTSSGTSVPNSIMVARSLASEPIWRCSVNGVEHYLVQISGAP